MSELLINEQKNNLIAQIVKEELGDECHDLARFILEKNQISYENIVAEFTKI